MNVLLTSVGRRSYLVDYFKKALNGNGLVIGANSDIDTSAMQVVDKAFEVPNVNSDNYILTLLDICKSENISLVVSLFDIDLPYLAKSKDKFDELGTCLVVSDKEVIDIANDKWSTYNFLIKNKLPTPQTYKSLLSFKDAVAKKEIGFPVVIKPRWGMGSLSVYKAENMEDVTFFITYCQRAIQSSYLNILSTQLDESVLVQQYITGKEFGVDVFNDLNSKRLVTVAKEKIAMRSGETDAAIVVDNPLIQSIANNLGDKLGHIGNLDIDILLDDLGNPYILEFNARFGGGYPFSHLAGVDFPSLLIQMAQGVDLDECLLKYKVGTKAIKFIQPYRI